MKQKLKFYDKDVTEKLKNPLKDITIGDKVGWEVGPLTVICGKTKNNKLRNMLVDCIGAKEMVFGNNNKK